MIFFFFDRIYQTLRNGYKASLMLNFLHTVAALCQQGIEPIQHYFPIRVIVFTLMLNSLLLYNFYTSSVVGSLLSTIPKGPSTINEIIDSPLTLSFEDIGFHKILFQVFIYFIRFYQFLYMRARCHVCLYINLFIFTGIE